MSPNERDAWAASLKVGDWVATVNGGFSHSWGKAQITAVKPPTDKRRGTLSIGSDQYWLPGGSSKGYRSSSILPYDDTAKREIDEQERWRAALRVIEGVCRWRDLPLATLEAVAAALKVTP